MRDTDSQVCPIEEINLFGRKGEQEHLRAQLVEQGKDFILGPCLRPCQRSRTQIGAQIPSDLLDPVSFPKRMDQVVFRRLSKPSLLNEHRGLRVTTYKYVSHFVVTSSAGGVSFLPTRGSIAYGGRPSFSQGRGFGSHPGRFSFGVTG